MAEAEKGLERDRRVGCGSPQVGLKKGIAADENIFKKFVTGDCGLFEP
jgi:hypothetical protein